MTDDLRDALSAAYDKVEENAPDAPEADAPERVEPEVGEGTESAEATRARDEQGRFAEKAATVDGKDKSREKLTLKGKSNAAQKPSGADNSRSSEGNAEVLSADGKGQKGQDGAVSQGTQSGAEAAQQGSAVQSAPLPPPAHWLGDAKKHWDRLPAEVRKSIVADGAQAQQATALQQAIGPAAEVLTREFGGVDRGLGAVLSTWNFARTNPVDFAKQFLQRYNIDPQTLAGGAPAPQSQQVDADPVLAPVLQRVQQLEALYQTSQQRQVEALNTQIQTEVQSFGNAILQDGQVAHPYFNDVRSKMAVLMQSPEFNETVQTQGGKAALEEAYTQACYATPQVRASLLAANEAKQAAERKRAAETARGAGASVAGAPGHRGPGMPQNETVGDSLSRAWEKAVSGARA